MGIARGFFMFRNFRSQACTGAWLRLPLGASIQDSVEVGVEAVKLKGITW
jgi:hypothetical protein